MTEGKGLVGSWKGKKREMDGHFGQDVDVVRDREGVAGVFVRLRVQWVVRRVRFEGGNRKKEERRKRRKWRRREEGRTKR